jgi:hypothetical protein
MTDPPLLPAPSLPSSPPPRSPSFAAPLALCLPACLPACSEVLTRLVNLEELDLSSCSLSGGCLQAWQQAAGRRRQAAGSSPAAASSVWCTRAASACLPSLAVPLAVNSSPPAAGVILPLCVCAEVPALAPLTTLTTLSLDKAFADPDWSTTTWSDRVQCLRCAAPDWGHCCCCTLLPQLAGQSLRVHQ